LSEHPSGELRRTPELEVERHFAANFFGVVATTKAVLPGMRERGGGTLLFTGREHFTLTGV
jgi:NAD(P)-dependent dehydrogenase (short-subunit alcohol dehydrogenase family)